ncbi:MAG: OmpA family protein, partial [Sphingobacteriales bacterium]|nr:OmpA family protein [Sphingobacteriales bacterium]
HYSSGPQDASYILNTGADTLRLKRFTDVSDFDDINNALSSASPKITKATAAKNYYDMSLPTSLTGSIDYRIARTLYINVGGMISLNPDAANLQRTHTANYFIVTPRYETKRFGVSFPIANNSISGFNAGFALRSGPLFFGSGSVLSTLIGGKTKQVDFHIGLIVNSLQRKKRQKKDVGIKDPVPVAITETLPIVVGVSDTDGDGINDDVDSCITAMGTAKYKGCPIPDTDRDGINDEEDKCPLVAGLAKYNGCKVPDTDGDGIDDTQDSCITVAGVEKYKGCPVPDTDKDGVNNELDKCPSIAGTRKYAGCPIPDTDKDGVNDELDKCPTIAGTVSNSGCPQIKAGLVQKMNFAAKGLQFKTGEIVILPQSFPKLNTVVEILKADTSLNLEIKGYTDNSGDAVKNQKLSADRANAAKAYLVKKGIKASRISAEGLGIKNPIAPNTTPEGRTKNRRVEFKLKN